MNKLVNLILLFITFVLLVIGIINRADTNVMILGGAILVINYISFIYTGVQEIKKKLNT